MHASSRGLALALVVALAAIAPLPSLGQALASELTGGDPCALIESLPEPTDPLRQAASVRRVFQALDRAGSDKRKLAKVHSALVVTLTGALDEATRVFHPKGVPSRKWGDKERRRARKYLEHWVSGPHPVLRVGEVGFEPVPGLRATLMYTACRSDRPEAALAYGRRATTADEGAARAFAALLLLEASRGPEATELVTELTGDTFLTAWVRAELSAQAGAHDDYRRWHATASRRIGTPAQAAAVDAQEHRHAQPATESVPTPEATP